MTTKHFTRHFSETLIFPIQGHRLVLIFPAFDQPMALHMASIVRCRAFSNLFLGELSHVYGQATGSALVFNFYDLAARLRGLDTVGLAPLLSPPCLSLPSVGGR